MKNLELSLEQAMKEPLYFLFLKDCESCAAYKRKAEQYEIPYLVAEDIYGVPLQAIEEDGKVYAPALWKGEQNVVSPNDQVIEIMVKQVRGKTTEEE